MNPESAARAGGGVPAHREFHVAELLFDLDGTLIDSTEAIEDAWRQWARAEGVAEPVAGAFHGRTARELVSALVPAERVSDAVERLGLLEQHPSLPIRPLPGVADMLAGIPADRWGVVTSATRAATLARLGAAGLPVPQRLITGDDVTRSKPDAEPFRTAQLLASETVRAVAFEDTVVGLQSARAAGCFAVGVRGTMSELDLHAHADAVITSFLDVSVESVDADGIRLRVSSGGG